MPPEPDLPPDLTVVMPAYNEEANLEPTVEALTARLRELGVAYELLVVDDASTDRTAAVARELADRDPALRLLRHPRNLGPGAGVATGLRAARGDSVMFIPADLAMDLRDLHKYFDSEADVVVGLRSDRRDYSAFRKLVSAVNIALIRLLFGMPLRQFNYIHRYRREVLEGMTLESRGVFLTAEILIKARDLGYRLEEVEVGYVPRRAGRASCGRPGVIARAVWELVRFWARRQWRRLRGRKP
ncbi:MAG: glycosyltransferase family 2 protein [Candidatus Brocadiia bacterium]